MTFCGLKKWGAFTKRKKKVTAPKKMNVDPLGLGETPERPFRLMFRALVSETVTRSTTIDATGGVTVPLYSSRVFCPSVQSHAKTPEGAGRRITARLLKRILAAAAKEERAPL